MTPEQRAAMGARHKPEWGRYNDDGHGPQPPAPCVACGQPWWEKGGDWYGCDARQALDGWREAEERAAHQSHGGLLLYTQQRDARIAEEALARRLALAVRMDRESSTRDRALGWLEVTDALAAYRERHPEEP